MIRATMSEDGSSTSSELSSRLANRLKNTQPQKPKKSNYLRINLNRRKYNLWTRTIRVIIGGKSTVKTVIRAPSTTERRGQATSRGGEKYATSGGDTHRTNDGFSYGDPRSVKPITNTIKYGDPRSQIGSRGTTTTTTTRGDKKTISEVEGYTNTASTSSGSRKSCEFGGVAAADGKATSATAATVHTVDSNRSSTDSIKTPVTISRSYHGRGSLQEDTDFEGNGFVGFSLKPSTPPNNNNN